jgi:phosphomannomutase
MAKKKLELDSRIDLEALLQKIKERYKHQRITDVDGVRIDFDREWVHLRRSNTEPIVRIYSESSSMEQANLLANRIIEEVKNSLD